MTSYSTPFNMSLFKSFYIFVLVCVVCRAIAADGAWPTVAPSHILATSFGATIGSAKINELLLTPSQRRQEETCEFPGGPICDAVSCCRPGEKCCPGGCCPEADQCVGGRFCCQQDAIVCTGGVGCCRSGASCCGGGCCPAGTICERNECIDSELINSIVKFELDKAKNKELLKNMCEGMRRNNGGKTKNTEVLTYRGKEKGGQSRGPIRRKAGCVTGYCTDTKNNGGDPANDSCDEYPPASSLEGGNTRPPEERITVCLPHVQNSHQGGKFTDMLNQYKAANNGQELLKDEKFVISIDCEAIAQARRELFTYPQLVARDAVSSFGTGAVDPDMRLTNNASEFVLLALGDLASGTYTINVQVTAGATSGGYIFDNEGDETFASSTSGLTTGQSQQYNLTLDDDRFGLGIVLITDRNDTLASFNLTGTTIDPSTSRAGIPTPTQSITAGNGPLATGTAGRSYSHLTFTSLGTACAMILYILNSARMINL